MTIEIVFACALGSLFLLWWLAKQNSHRIIAKEAPLSLLIATALMGTIGHSLNFLALWANAGQMPLIEWQDQSLSGAKVAFLVDLMELRGSSIGDCFLYTGRVLLIIAFFVSIKRWLIKKVHF